MGQGEGTGDGTAYELVRLAGGAVSVRSRRIGETFHPVIGPVAEAEALYVRQLRLADRAGSEPGGLVIWDVGLGAAANVLTVLRALRGVRCPVRVVSFDETIEPLRFGLARAAELGYFAGYEPVVDRLARDGEARFENGVGEVWWSLRMGDFPALADSPEAIAWPKPHAILFDAYSPARNPGMWTLPLFSRLYGLLDPRQGCALATYSRSTMLRVTLLRAGFWVGHGGRTGEKEETTIAANRPELIERPLNGRWLERARRSTSAEPLMEPVYRQARLSAASLEALPRHPQFIAQGSAGNPADNTGLQPPRAMGCLAASVFTPTSESGSPSRPP